MAVKVRRINDLQGVAQLVRELETLLNTLGVDTSGNISSVTNLTLTGLLTESVTSGITAGTTRTQAGATALTKEVNRVNTSTAPAAGTMLGDGVVLPAATAGLTIVVANNTANPVQVYGAGADTVNGQTNTVGVTQMQGSVVIYVASAAGTWVAEGIGTGFSGSLMTESAVNGITAFAGGGQGSAVSLPAMMNRVTTVASANDSVKLPLATVGLSVTAVNAAAANSMNVFPSTGDAINALGANAAFAVTANKTVTFFCVSAGVWHSILSA